MPRAWVVLRRIWLATFVAALGLVVLLPVVYAKMGPPPLFSYFLSLPGWILLGMAAMLFLLPHSTHDVIVCSPQELRAWQLKSLLGALLIGLAASMGAFQLKYAHGDWCMAAACVGLILCLFLAPYFFRLSAWRIWAGTAMVFAACFCR
jgi:hypothetical protein